MNSVNTIIGIAAILMLNTPTKESTDVNVHFEKTKGEILAGRKFNDQSTPANALLTLISALHHQDQNAFEQVFPYARQVEDMFSPQARSEFLDWFRNSVVCKIQRVKKSPEESDLCGIHTTASPGQQVDDQVWLLAHMGGAWRLLRSTNDTDVTEWRTIVEEVEAITRKILQFEAKSTGISTSSISQEEAERIEGKWDVLLVESGQRFVIRFWRQPDDTLTGALTLYRPDDRPLEDVSFKNGRLRFKENKNLAIFDGTMKEDGLTIEGKLQKPDEAFTLVLKRVEPVRPKVKAQVDTEAVQVPQEQIQIKSDSGVAQASQEPLHDRVSDTSHRGTILTLLLLMTGIIGVIALFVVKQSRG